MKSELTLNDVVLGNLRGGGKQNVLLTLGVAFAIFFLSVSVLGASCFLASSDEYQKNRVGEANVVLHDIREADVSELITGGVFRRVVPEEILYSNVGDPGNKDDDFPIARLSEDVRNMMRVRVREGELPNEAGEIAIESAALLLMRSDAKLGDRITLTLQCFDGEAIMENAVQKEFTLVGILENTGRNANETYGSDRPVLFWKLPEAYVSPDEPILPGTRELRNGLCQYVFGFTYKTEPIDEWWARNRPAGSPEWLFVNWVYNPYSLMNGGEEGAALLFALVIVFLALTIAAMTGIASALTSSIDKRKTQIGMLRAIGATNRQIKRLLRRETLTIAAITLPMGVGFAALLLWGASRLFSDYVVYSVPIWLIALDSAACLACVLLSSALPVRHSMKITPMQAVRDVDLMRSFRWTERKSRESFVPQRLLAKRNNAMRPGKTAMLSILVCAGTMLFTVMFHVCGDQYKSLASMRGDHPAYTIHNYISFGGGFGFMDDPFVNRRFYTGRLTASDKAELANLPYVSYVESEQCAAVAVLTDTVTDYINCGGTYGDYLSYLSPEVSAFNKVIRSMGYIGLYDEAELRENALRRYEAYRRMMDELNWPGEALAMSIAGCGAERLKSLEQYVTEGEIRPDKLASGEEVLIVAPREYAVVITVDDEDSYGIQTKHGDEIPRDEVTAYQNDMFRAGDELSLGFCWLRGELNRDAYGLPELPEEYEAFTRKAKIGAVLELGLGTLGFSSFQVITSEAGLAALGIDANYEELSVYLSGEPDEETRAYLAERVDAVASRSAETHVYDYYEEYRDYLRSILITTAVCAVILILLFVFTWALVGGAVAGRIRSEVRKIGTMRAVGASKRAVFGMYANQFVRIFGIGGGIGWALSSYAVYLIRYQWDKTGLFWREGIWYCMVAPAYLIAIASLCMASVWGKLRPIFRSSVVDNIRIL